MDLPERQETDICMDKKPDGMIVYATDDPKNPSQEAAASDPLDDSESHENSNGNSDLPNIEENSEAIDYDVKECTNEIPIDEEITSEKSTGGSKSMNMLKDGNKSKVPTKCASRQGPGNNKTKHTVPQPFALATERRASSGTRSSTGESKMLSYGKIDIRNQASKMPRKPLQPKNKKNPDEEDSCSLSNFPKSRSYAVTTAPMFRCSQRAERRKEFYTKLEEKHQALEAERTQSEARNKEETMAAIRQLRKSLMFKANPMPSFYNEEPPPKIELKKVPPTRAKSPKLGQRKNRGNRTRGTPQPANGGKCKNNGNDFQTVYAPEDETRHGVVLSVIDQHYEPEIGSCC